MQPIQIRYLKSSDIPENENEHALVVTRLCSSFAVSRDYTPLGTLRFIAKNRTEFFAGQKAYFSFDEMLRDLSAR